MSAILSLLVETLIYGLVILLIVTLLLWASISFFSIDNPVNPDIYNKGYHYYYALYSTKLVKRAMIASDGIVAFPVYFSKRAESLLDVCFLTFPTLMVVIMLLPTLGFLYNHEFSIEHVATSLSIDVVGHQWYWSYEYHLASVGDLFDFAFDSILDVDAVENANLSVDRHVVIPTDVYISVTVTSTDVIHS